VQQCNPYVLDPYICKKNEGQRSVGLKDGGKQIKGQTRLITLPCPLVQSETSATVSVVFTEIKDDGFVVMQASLKWIESVRDMSRQKLNAELSAMNAATAQLVTLTAAGPDNMDYVAVNSAIQAMSVAAMLL